MCHELGVEVVAEGVETREELSVLSDIGVDFFQGYFFSRPLFERLATDAEINYT